MGQLNAYTYLNAILQNAGAGGMPQLLLPPPGQILHQMGFIQQMMMAGHVDDFDDGDDGQIGGGPAGLLMPPHVPVPGSAYDADASDASDAADAAAAIEQEEMEEGETEAPQESESVHAPLLLTNEAIDMEFHNQDSNSTNVDTQAISAQMGAMQYSPIIGPTNNILNPEDELDITPSNNILNPEDEIAPFSVRSSIQNIFADYSEDAENIPTETDMDNVD